MKALARVAALAALIALPAQARELKDIMAAPIPFKDPANGFALSYPGGWKVSKGDAAVAFYAQGKRPGEALFVTRPTPSTKTFETVYKEAKEAMPGAQAVTLNLNGNQVARLDLEATSGGQKYHARTYVLVAGKKLYNVTMRCLAKDYAQEAVVFDNVQRSLKFNK